MTTGDPAGAPDPRAAALADYLRRSAAAFSMSADVTGVASTADAGMALLDAALLAERLPSGDATLRVLSEAGLFESMPGGRAAFVEHPDVRAAILRALVSGEEDAACIIAKLVATAATLDDRYDEPR